MRLTKGTKKALSLALSAALVVTGASFEGTKSAAADNSSDAAAATGSAVASGSATSAPAVTGTPEVTSAPAITSAPAVTETPAPTEEPTAAPVVKGDMDKFTVGFNYVGDDTWGESTWGDTTVDVTGDGNYSISYTASSDSKDLYMLFLTTDLYKGSLNANFKLNATYVAVGSKEYKVDVKGPWGFNDQQDTNAYRYNIVNPFNGSFDDTGLSWQDPKVTAVDGLGVCPVKAGDIVKVYFTVSGMNKKNSAANELPAAAATVKAAKKAVSVAPGKSTTVKFTAGTTVKATSSDKAVTVKVNNTKKTATITAKSTAVMGKTATVTLKTASKKATVKVTVAKTANVKKNKTAKYSVVLSKVTKKVKADKVKVSVKNNKIAKVTVNKTAKDQVTFSVKGLKKGQTTATLKSGKKSVKVSVVVK